MIEILELYVKNNVYNVYRIEKSKKVNNYFLF